MYLLGCISASTGEIFMKIHVWHSMQNLYKRNELAAISEYLRVLYLKSNVPFRLNLGFHGRDFPENSYLSLQAHSLQTGYVWLRLINNSIITGLIFCSKYKSQTKEVEKRNTSAAQETLSSKLRWGNGYHGVTLVVAEEAKKKNNSNKNKKKKNGGRGEGRGRVPKWNKDFRIPVKTTNTFHDLVNERRNYTDIRRLHTHITYRSNNLYYYFQLLHFQLASEWPKACSLSRQMFNPGPCYHEGGGGMLIWMDFRTERYAEGSGTFLSWSLSIVGYKDPTPFRNAFVFTCLLLYIISSIPSLPPAS